MSIENILMRKRWSTVHQGSTWWLWGGSIVGKECRHPQDLVLHLRQGMVALHVPEEKSEPCLNAWPTLLTASPTNTIFPLTKVFNGGYKVWIDQRLGCWRCCRIILASFPHSGYPSITSCWGTVSIQGEGRSGEIERSFPLMKATTFSFNVVKWVILYDKFNTYNSVVLNWECYDVLYEIKYQFHFRISSEVVLYATEPNPGKWTTNVGFHSRQLKLVDWDHASIGVSVETKMAVPDNGIAGDTFNPIGTNDKVGLISSVVCKVHDLTTRRSSRFHWYTTFAKFCDVSIQEGYKGVEKHRSSMVCRSK